MPEKKRQRTLIDFNIPRAAVLPGNVKRPHTAPIFIDLEADDIDEDSFAEKSASKEAALIDTKPLFVTDEYEECTGELVEKPSITEDSKVKKFENIEECKFTTEALSDESLSIIKFADKRELSIENDFYVQDQSSGQCSSSSNRTNTPNRGGQKTRQSGSKFPIKLRYVPEIKRQIFRAKPPKVDLEESGAEVKQLISIAEVGQEQQVLCPVCGVVLTKLEVHERESHCDRCAELGPQIPKKRTGKPLPKLPQVKKIYFKNHVLVVDGFNFDTDPTIKQYFLSHFHADHYMGVKKSWNQGSVYCSKITADLLAYKFKVPEERIVALPEDVTVQIAENVSVICFDANHCPGAFVFLFREFDKDNNTVQWILHTGDFRSNDKLISRINSHTNGKLIDKVYLDTTYMYPSYHFPLQKSVLEVTGDFTSKLSELGFKKLFDDRQSSIMNFLSGSLRSRHLYKFVFVVGTYTIGKEKLAVAIAQKLNTKIFLPKDTTKHRIFQTYENIFPEGLITHDITKSCVHLVSMRTLASKDSLQFYFKPISHIYEDMISFSPTGWSFKNGGKFIKLHESPEQKRDHTLGLLNNSVVDQLDANSIYSQYNRQARFQVFRVPYSEHSSFKDLANFCVKVPWIKMIPTVNNHNEYMMSQMEEWFKAWKKIQRERKL
ncbi:LANO_0H02982g1_1 [Lachancea nothofagi CBS 11611]|uniref:LANO_0H02982g1_1 n=1 Tax=Lachancea nothofagi CBS 11611 TaxID=1266666 RepID=A0A1G4KLF8_9SACH|nr:LANO_0H02982g1_1 [Lachancea nothofagi CBS 11611]